MKTAPRHAGRKECAIARERGQEYGVHVATVEQIRDRGFEVRQTLAGHTRRVIKNQNHIGLAMAFLGRVGIVLRDRDVVDDANRAIER